MKILSVPYAQQEKGSLDCGPACLEMVLKYFGIDRDVTDLIARLEYTEGGTSAYDNGRLVLEAGLSVVAITRQPLLFSPETERAVHATAIDEIYEERRKALEKYKAGIDKVRVFLQKGGTLIAEIPSIGHIRRAIDEAKPIIALLHARSLGKNEGGFHFVVVNGYDDASVHLLNPLPGSRQEGWFPIEDFLYAVHSSTTADIDNGTLLIVGR
jgi:hypothetical protein